MAVSGFVLFPHHSQNATLQPRQSRLRRPTLLKRCKVPKRLRCAPDNLVPNSRLSDYFNPDHASAPEYGPAPTDVFKIGDIVSERYKILGILGRGANGVTYEAECLTADRDIVALKVLSLRGMSNWKSLELFHREGSTLRSLNHPEIPSYIDSFEVSSANDVAYVLVQHKAHGQSLQRLINARYRFSADQIFSICKQLLELLAYLGALFPPVVHRDIKPSNVIIDLNAVDETGDKYPQVSLVDFGGVNSTVAASAPAATSAGPGSTMVGTFGYMAPEQFGGFADPRTDLYATGATILCALTGISPAELPRKRLKIDLEALFSVRERANLGRVYLVMQRLLEPAPEDRFESADRALAALLGEEDLMRMPIDSADDARVQMLFGETRALTAMEVDVLRAELLQLVHTSVDVKDSRRTSRSGFGLMSWLWKGRRALRRPAGTRVVVDRDESNRILCVTIPPPGFSAETVYSGAFALVWNAILASWTVGAVLSGGGAILTSLFSAPFWFVGAKLARIPIADLRGTTCLLVCNGVGKKKPIYFFRLASTGPFGRLRIVEGDARDIYGVAIEQKMYDQGYISSALVLREGTKTHKISDALVAVEEDWLRDEINDFLGVGG